MVTEPHIVVTQNEKVIRFLYEIFSKTIFCNSYLYTFPYLHIWLGILHCPPTTVSGNSSAQHAWDNTAGKNALHLDGVQRSNGTLKKGYMIKGTGHNGHKVHSFVGELTGINTWNRVLGPREISAMSINRMV